jgi:glutathione S-transferase
MKLFYVPGTCSVNPHILLREMGVDFKLDKVDRTSKMTESGLDYNALNPKSYVPALDVDGTVLTEGAAISMFLADQPGGEKIAPKAGTMERYKMQEWLVFISSELHKSYGPLFRKSTDPAFRENLAKRLAFVDKHLETHDYLVGDKFSAADSYLFTVLRWSPRVDVTLPPHVMKLMERIKARPAVAKVLEVEGLN